jgi:hypothetical protein
MPGISSASSLSSIQGQSIDLLRPHDHLAPAADSMGIGCIDASPLRDSFPFRMLGRPWRTGGRQGTTPACRGRTDPSEADWSKSGVAQQSRDKERSNLPRRLMGDSVGDPTDQGRVIGLHGPNSWCSNAFRRALRLPPATTGQATAISPHEPPRFASHLARVGRIDRRFGGVTSRPNASLHACRHRIASGYGSQMRRCRRTEARKSDRQDGNTGTTRSDRPPIRAVQERRDEQLGGPAPPDSALEAPSMGSQAGPELTVADVMTPSPRTCSPFSKEQQAVMVFRDCDCVATPVVDAGLRLHPLTSR